MKPGTQSRWGLVTEAQKGGVPVVSMKRGKERGLLANLGVFPTHNVRGQKTGNG